MANFELSNIVDNGDTEVTVSEAIPAQALEYITRGEIDVQIATAKRWPRSLARFSKDALSLATLDEETASSCFYVLKRGFGKDAKTIEGPGIRLAEIVGSAWGNLRLGSMITEITDEFVVARGMAHDLETNVAIATETRRRITGKDGRRYSDDMIVMTSNAACSIALRNAIYRVVPRALVDQVMNQAKRVAVGDAQTLEVRRSKAVDHFVKSGVALERIFGTLEVNGMEEVTLKHLETLTGLKTAIKDGVTTLDEAFPPLKTRMVEANLAGDV